MTEPETTTTSLPPLTAHEISYAIAVLKENAQESNGRLIVACEAIHAARVTMADMLSLGWAPMPDADAVWKRA